MNWMVLLPIVAYIPTLLVFVCMLFGYGKDRKVRLFSLILSMMIVGASIALQFTLMALMGGEFPLGVLLYGLLAILFGCVIGLFRGFSVSLHYKEGCVRGRYGMGFILLWMGTFMLTHLLTAFGSIGTAINSMYLVFVSLGAVLGFNLTQVFRWAVMRSKKRPWVDAGANGIAFDGRTGKKMSLEAKKAAATAVLLLFAITHLAVIPAAYATTDVSNSLVLLIDTSGSMSGQKLQEAIAAAQSAVSRVGYGTEVALITYSGSCGANAAHVVSGFTTNTGEISSALSGLSAGGGTPMSCAIAYATEYMKMNARGRQGRIILLCDGQNDCPHGAVAAARDGIYQNTIPVRLNTIGFDLAPGSTAEQELRDVADAGGGRYSSADDAASLEDAFIASTTGGTNPILEWINSVFDDLGMPAPFVSNDARYTQGEMAAIVTIALVASAMGFGLQGMVDAGLIDGLIGLLTGGLTLDNTTEGGGGDLSRTDLSGGGESGGSAPAGETTTGSTQEGGAGQTPDVTSQDSTGSTTATTDVSSQDSAGSTTSTTDATSQGATEPTTAPAAEPGPGTHPIKIFTWGGPWTGYDLWDNQSCLQTNPADTEDTDWYPTSGSIDKMRDADVVYIQNHGGVVTTDPIPIVPFLDESDTRLVDLGFSTEENQGPSVVLNYGCDTGKDKYALGLGIKPDSTTKVYVGFTREVSSVTDDFQEKFFEEFGKGNVSAEDAARRAWGYVCTDGGFAYSKNPPSFEESVHVTGNGNLTLNQVRQNLANRGSGGGGATGDWNGGATGSW